MKKLALSGLLFIPTLVLADGKALHDSACIQCHAALMNGDANQMYQRLDKKVMSLGALVKRVDACATAADASWNKAQKAEVVDYLNQQFYSFSN
jgi:mono/diheme cytochrome c family protein